MKTLLWTQSVAPGTPDLIVKDSAKCSRNEECQQVFNLLSSYNQRLSLSPKDRDYLYGRFEKYGFSHQANYHIGSSGVYLQGCFFNVDNIGRKLPYMFYDSEAKTVKEAIISLKEIAEKFDKKCNPKELEILEGVAHKNEKKKQRNKTYLFVVTIILLIIILVRFIK